ncbi:MAG: hypothetical protein CV087_10300 [Candidatus Brocadia sp. WS118]|nr:MAG: hypothetical protein CV087_10300 [Candidatus Brocadia sp. WS118]
MAVEPCIFALAILTSCRFEKIRDEFLLVEAIMASAFESLANFYHGANKSGLLFQNQWINGSLRPAEPSLP